MSPLDSTLSQRAEVHTLAYHTLLTATYFSTFQVASSSLQKSDYKFYSHSLTLTCALQNRPSLPVNYFINQFRPASCYFLWNAFLVKCETNHDTQYIKLVSTWTTCWLCFLAQQTVLHLDKTILGFMQLYVINVTLNGSHPLSILIIHFMS
jgi:hypothetical protein